MPAVVLQLSYSLFYNDDDDDVDDDEVDDDDDDDDDDDEAHIRGFMAANMSKQNKL